MWLFGGGGWCGVCFLRDCGLFKVKHKHDLSCTSLKCHPYETSMDLGGTTMTIKNHSQECCE